MWPPRPPSPPFGPPNSLYFSWRNETQPFPPSPAAMSMNASSTNFMMAFALYKGQGPGLPGPWFRPVSAGLRGALDSGRRGNDADRLLVQGPLGLERHLA